MVLAQLFPGSRFVCFFAVGLLILLGQGVAVQAQFATNMSRQFFERAQERGDMAAAELHLTRILEANPRDIQALYSRVFVRKARGNRKGALEDAMAIDRLGPGNVFGMMARLAAMTDYRSREEINKLVEEMIENHSDFPLVPLLAAYHFATDAEFDRALQIVEKSIEAQEAAQEAGEALAMGSNFLPQTLALHILLLYDAGRPDDAAKALTQALLRFPTDENIQESRLEILLAEGRFPEALASFKALFSSRPKSDLNTWYDRAQAYLLTGQWDNAISDLKEIMGRDVTHAQPHIVLSGIYLLQGKYREAEAQITQNLTTILAQRSEHLHTSNSLISTRQDLVTQELLGISTVNPYFNRALARHFLNRRNPALQDARLAAQGNEIFPPYPPAELLVKALESRSRIRLDPQPISLEELEKAAPQVQTQTEENPVRAVIESLFGRPTE
jgi:tetratricopeptide (TPR) repeat protein